MTVRPRSWTDRAALPADTDGSDSDERELGPMTDILVVDILDVRVLDDLAEDLGDPAARRIAEQYRDGLDQRLKLLATATFDRSVCAVYDTAVDLAVSGATVGAVALARAAWAAAQDVLRYRTLPRMETLERLMRLAHDTEAALTLHLAGERPPSPHLVADRAGLLEVLSEISGLGANAVRGVVEHRTAGEPDRANASPNAMWRALYDLEERAARRRA